MTLPVRLRLIYFKFMGTKSCSKTTCTAAAATIMHASTVGEGTDRLVRKALIAGIGLGHQRVEDLAKSITMTGSIGHCVASHAHDDLEQLSNDQWIGLLKLVVELICFDINKAKSFEQCKLSNFKKPSEAIAQFTSLHMCTNARNIHGKEYMTAYERFTLLTTKLPAEAPVEIEIQEYLATHKGINILEMEWSDADNIINDAWGTYVGHMNADLKDITDTGFHSLMTRKSRRGRSCQPTQDKWSDHCSRG